MGCPTWPEIWLKSGLLKTGKAAGRETDVNLPPSANHSPLQAIYMHCTSPACCAWSAVAELEVWLSSRRSWGT